VALCTRLRLVDKNLSIRLIKIDARKSGQKNKPKWLKKQATPIDIVFGINWG
jgi:hypothetical protein